MEGNGGVGVFSSDGVIRGQHAVTTDGEKMFKLKLTSNWGFGRLWPHTVTKQMVRTMRTKTLLLTATALCVAAIASASAQVYSVNAVGYVNKTVPVGQFAILVNPLNTPTNNITSVLPTVPVGTVVYTWSGTAFKLTSYVKPIPSLPANWSGGDGPNTMLNPGTGFIVKNASTTEEMKITFVGEVPQGDNMTVPFAAGFNLVGSIVPQSGKVATDLGLPVQVGDSVYKMTAAGAYDIRNYVKPIPTLPASWSGGGEPTVEVAEGFWYKAAGAGN